MNQTKKYQLLFKKTIAVILLTVSVSFSPIGHKKADAWLSPFAAILGSTYKQMLEYVQKMAEGIALSQAKMQAIKKISGEVGSMASGSSNGGSSNGGSSSNGAKFITDWKDHLETAPEKKTALYMNDYISQFFNGQGSSNYTSASGDSGGGNSTRELQQALKELYKVKNNNQSETSKIDFGGTNQNTGALALVDLMLNPKKNVFGAYLAMQGEYDKKIEENKQIAQTQAIAYQGYKGTESNGKITTPGINIKDMVSNTQNMANEAIVNAQDIWSVLSTLASKEVTKMMEEGIGSAQDSAQQESGNTQEKQNTETQNNVNRNGPGALFGN